MGERTDQKGRDDPDEQGDLDGCASRLGELRRPVRALGEERQAGRDRQRVDDPRHHPDRVPGGVVRRREHLRDHDREDESGCALGERQRVVRRAVSQEQPTSGPLDARPEAVVGEHPSDLEDAEAHVHRTGHRPRCEDRRRAGVAEQHREQADPDHGCCTEDDAAHEHLVATTEGDRELIEQDR